MVAKIHLSVEFWIHILPKVVLTDLLRYLIAALATMFSSRNEVPPRLFTTKATLSPATCEKQNNNKILFYLFSNKADINNLALQK